MEHIKWLHEVIDIADAQQTSIEVIQALEYVIKSAEAKLQMEKEQIVGAFKEGLKSPYHQDYTLVTQEGQEETKSGQYYNEQYGGEQ